MTDLRGVDGVGARPARSVSRRREEILRVASRLVNQRGMEFTLQDIADELGITYNALYRHFRNRDELILSCLVRSIDLMRRSLDDAISSGPVGRVAIIEFVRSFVDLAAIQELPSGRYVVALTADAQALLYEQLTPVRRSLTALVQRGIDDGSIPPIDASITSTWLIHVLGWWPDERLGGSVAPDRVTTVITLVDRALGGTATIG